MTREALEARIAAYRADMEAVKQKADATIHALSGAIQDCEHWLEVLQAEERETWSSEARSSVVGLKEA